MVDAWWMDRRGVVYLRLDCSGGFVYKPISCGENRCRNRVLPPPFSHLEPGCELNERVGWSESVRRAGGAFDTERLFVEDDAVITYTTALISAALRRRTVTDGMTL
jgi:hypothetical protein